jgi:hypothetical protein
MPQYQGVWTLEAQAQAQSNQQWVTDPNFKNTTLLLQADGTGSGSQNQSFIDSSTNNFFIARFGNTTQGSFSPFSQAPGYWSAYEGVNGNYFTSGTSSVFGFGTGDFTFEFFIYIVGFSDNQFLIDFRPSGSASSTKPWLYLNTSGTLIYGTSGANQITGGTVTGNTWLHVAVSKVSNNTRMFLNGVQVGSTYVDANNYGTSERFVVGTFGDAPGATNNNGGVITGYISNLRILKGTGLYTSLFTVPNSPLTVITNTSVLTFQNNRFIDNSGNSIAITPSGSPSVQSFGPFAPALQWTPDVVGGSGYFDGTGDYLTGPSASGGDFSTGNFTISAWFYPTTLTGGTDHGIMSYADTGGWNGWQLQARGTARDIKFEFLTGSAGASTITGGSIVLNAWNYVAIVRSGSTVSMYVNSTTAATSTTNSTAYGAATSRVIVGADRSAASPFIGYISNSKLVKQANAPASIPTVPDTATTNTSLLLNYTNAGIYDGKMANNLETVGDAQVSTSPVKYGSGSIKFDGTGDYLKSNSGTDLYAFGAGDFTIECWVYFNTVASQVVYDGRPSGVQTTQPAIYMSGAGVLFYYVNGANVITGATLTSGQWYHIAVCRANSQTRMFLNGVQTGSTYSDTVVYTNTAGRPLIGNDGFNLTNPLNGYIDDLRVTKGVARYIANFTPPQQALPRQ